MNQIQPLKLGEKLGFGTFSMSNNIVYQFKSLYYLFFLTNVLRIPILTAGTILAAGTIWDAVNDPVIGYTAVNRRFKNGERCRPFALWFSLPWAVTLVLLFSDFGVSVSHAGIIALAVYIVFEVFNTLVGIPYNSMGSLATNVDSDRRSINAFRNFGACLGSGIGAVACLPLLRLFGGLNADGNLNPRTGSRGFFLVSLVMGTVIIVGSLIHFFTTKERVKPIGSEEKKLSVREVTRMLFGCRSWILNMVYILCYGVINLLLMSCIAYYATYVLGSTASATLIQAAYLAASVITTFFISPIDRKLGRKKTMILGVAVAMGGKIWFLINPFSLGAIYLNAVTVGFSVAVAFIIFNTNRNNIVDIIEWRDGRRLDSLVSTADNLASKLATAGALELVAMLLNSAGFNADLAVQPAGAVGAINFLLGWAPLIVSVGMLLAVLFLNIEEDTARMIREKAEAASKTRA
ncbi:MAG: glycoside-pentoside-hexuronide (GPH):cation symporter [Treponema sp.]|jgi:sugar (glycoside-pentoside-hexuronide) transporter|nr:glycoside-pentoside-hexuronide (GPH):cation symporter [Treponema sp.]